jgi:hypothetical protein
MYQLLFTTNDNSGKTFAANVPAREAEYITETLCTAGGFLRFGVDIYDEQISAKSCEGYGQFRSKKELLEWLYLNVFAPCKDFATLEDFKRYYSEQLAAHTEAARIENVCINILYNDYTTGWESENVYNRLRPYIADCISNDNQQHPGKAYLRRAIRRAFVELAAA